MAYSVEKLDRDVLARGSRKVELVGRARFDDRRLGKGSMTPANATREWISEFFNRIGRQQSAEAPDPMTAIRRIAAARIHPSKGYGASKAAAHLAA